MSSASYASFTGLAILEFPRKITAKGLVFDASFTSNDEIFSDIGLYFVYTTVIITPAPSNSRTYSGFEDRPDGSFHQVFTGEGSGSPTPIPWWGYSILFYLGVPSEAGIDYRKPPYIHICGPAFDVNIPAATFSVTAEQYRVLWDVQKAAAKNGQTAASESFHFSLSFHYLILSKVPLPFYHLHHSGFRPLRKQQEPVPYNKRFVMVAGNITGMTSVLENDKIKDSYRVDVGNVVFLGTYVAPATPATMRGCLFVHFDAGFGEAGQALVVRHPDADDGRSSGPPSSPSPLN
ncbi:hypothetical protein MVEN_02470800 [Mycena venus]|uniref:Uncharacterized protein n=1 Tax=Mycena venus TaxID=2733690 RepID=A0A8H7CAV2_9AGAR|nr:hypothetical protein MVEN_02470800 [Mycena venus]